MTPDLRYPIGPFVRPDTSTITDRASRIDTLAQAPAALRAAVNGLSEAQLDTPYRDGGWTVRQVVHHLADSHLNAYIRVRLVLTEHEPPLKPYDEQAWAALIDARTGPIAWSLSILDGIHARWTALAHTMPGESYARVGLHQANGPMTLDALFAMYAWHSQHHVAHITGLRERNGW